jgi:hypothetical protein
VASTWARLRAQPPRACLTGLAACSMCLPSALGA